MTWYKIFALGLIVSFSGALVFLISQGRTKTPVTLACMSRNGAYDPPKG
jgi:hypothetical protein